MSTWTVKSIGDQTGKTVIVTGANSGVGLHTAAALVANGAHVIMACRDLSRSAPALDKVRISGPGTVEMRELDLADLDSVAEFSRGVSADFERLDVLVNNAGIMGGPRRETAQGYELQVGTNHLGHFALTGSLWPLLEAAPEARVVALTSLAARGGTLEPGMQSGDLTNPDPYKEMTVYSNSKQANLLFSQELHRRSAASSSNVQSFAAHPGVSSTNLFTRQLDDRNLGALAPLANGLGKLLLQSATAGATPAIRAATDPTIPSGSFIGPDALGQTRGTPEVIGVYRTGRNPETAAELWDLSEQLTDTALLTSGS